MTPDLGKRLQEQGLREIRFSIKIEDPAKVFGTDVPRVESILKRNHIEDYVCNRDYDFLEFHVRNVALMRGLGLEVAISFCVLETRGDGEYLRELKVALIRPESFNWQEEL